MTTPPAAGGAAGLPIGRRDAWALLATGPVATGAAIKCLATVNQPPVAPK